MRSFLYVMAVFLPVCYWGIWLRGDQGTSLLKEYLRQSNQERLICEAFGSAAADMAYADLTLTEADWVGVGRKNQYIEYSEGDFPIRNTMFVQVYLNPKSGLCEVILHNTEGKKGQLGGRPLLTIGQKIEANKDRWFQVQIDPHSGERLYLYLGHRINESYLSGLAANGDALQNRIFYYSRLPEQRRAGNGIFRIGEQESIDSVSKFIFLVYKKLVDPAEEYIRHNLQRRWRIFYWLLVVCGAILCLLFITKNKRKNPPTLRISRFEFDPDAPVIPPRPATSQESSDPDEPA